MSTPLLDTINRLTQDHLHRTTNDDGEDNWGQEEALLDTLHAMITPGGANAAGGGSEGGTTGSKSRPLVNLDALALWQAINRKVDAGWPYAGHPSAVRVPLKRKLTAWGNTTTEPHEALRLYELCARWEDGIRRALEPIRRMPLKGACPECMKTHVELDDDNGRVKFDTAIIAYPGSVPVYAECRVCFARWDHEQLHELAARLT